jgi:hypothetical protein
MIEKKIWERVKADNIPIFNIENQLVYDTWKKNKNGL